MVNIIKVIMRSKIKILEGVNLCIDFHSHIIHDIDDGAKEFRICLLKC